jgi:glycosyltransferase involved in cell wall biosynthesis
VVRTLHDMNAFTGGCHYDGGCGRHVERCGRCPQLARPAESDLSRQVWERKRAVLRRVPAGRLHFVTPSRWLAGELKRSSLLAGFPVTVIPYGVDTDLFRPVDRGWARDLLRIPPDALVVLLVAEPITRRVKGFGMLVEALDLIGDGRVVLLSAGTGTPPVEARCPHAHLGHVGDQRLLPVVYGAADLLVIPSLQDNSPQVVLEAMACGLPVIGYASGGIPDLIRHHDTGLLVPTGDVPALGAAIGRLLHDRRERLEMGTRARDLIGREHTPALQARRYLTLYESLLASCAPAREPSLQDTLAPTHGSPR